MERVHELTAATPHTGMRAVSVRSGMCRIFERSKVKNVMHSALWSRRTTYET